MTSSLNESTTPKRRWYAPTVAKLLLAILLMQGVLFLSSHYHWFWFNERKGYTVLITVAATAVLLLVALVAALVACLFTAKWQFSLSLLLGFVVVMGIPLGWLGGELHRSRQQRKTIAEITILGGYVVYSDGSQVTRHGRVYESLRSIALRNVSKGNRLGESLEGHLGEDFFLDVHDVWLKRADDNSLQALQVLPHLQSLFVEVASVSDEGIKSLQALGQLRALTMNCSIYAPLSHITDVGIGHLRVLRHLGELELNNADVTDSGLAHLGTMGPLRSLRIEQVPPGFTDQGLLHLMGLKELRTLKLYGPGLSDASLQEFAKPQRLENLDIRFTSITDAGLERLKKYRPLTRLYLPGANVTDQGVQGLREAWPHCRIECNLQEMQAGSRP